MKKSEDEEKRKRGELPSMGKDTPKLTKEEAKKIWDSSLNNVPDDYNFIIRSYNEG